MRDKLILVAYVLFLWADVVNTFTITSTTVATKRTPSRPFVGRQSRLTVPTERLIPLAFDPSKPRLLFLSAKAVKGPGGDEDDADLDFDDVPDDWTDDIVEEIGDIADANLDDDEEDEESGVDEDDVEDEDEDDIDPDDIDLELDEEEDEDEEDIDDDSLVLDIKDEYASDDGKYYDDDVNEDDEEWDLDDDGGNYELMDDLDDANYMKQKELVKAKIAASKAQARAESFDPIDFVLNEMTEEQSAELEQLPFFKQVEEEAQKLQTLTEEDLAGIDIAKELEKIPDLMLDDPYPRHEPDEVNIVEQDIGLTYHDMEKLDHTYKRINELVTQEPWDKVMAKDMSGAWDHLTNKTIEEMEMALEEIGGAAYNVTRWLLYDLDFNASNLMLAAVKHNREAPILFAHWYPQLVTYERYQHARDRNFDFTWEDVENADISELERYYAGFGYSEIPSKAPAETGITGFEELDEEEIKMAAFENWMTEVYNPEWDRKDFDDESMTDEDNVFSKFYVAPQHPDLPTMEDAEEDIDLWNMECEEEEMPAAYRDMMGKKFEYEVVWDEEFEREFRGHLVIACTGQEKDLDVAEKITIRFQKEFGKQVYVETQVMSLAREEDNVFEIWLESYEVDLLHSKRRATSFTEDWTGPAECNDKEIDYLVDRV